MKRLDSTPRQDGYRMPGEFEPQDGVYMLWPQRTDNWRNGAKPAQEVFVKVASTIAKYEKMIEPVVTSFMGIIAGVFAGGLLTPIYNLVSSL